MVKDPEHPTEALGRVEKSREVVLVPVEAKFRAAFDRLKYTEGMYHAVRAAERKGAPVEQVETLRREAVAEKIAYAEFLTAAQLLKSWKMGTPEDQRTLQTLEYTMLRHRDPGAARILAVDLWGEEDVRVRAIDAERRERGRKAYQAVPENQAIFSDSFVAGVRKAVREFVGEESVAMRTFDANVEVARDGYRSGERGKEPELATEIVLARNK